MHRPWARIARTSLINQIVFPATPRWKSSAAFFICQHSLPEKFITIPFALIEFVGEIEGLMQSHTTSENAPTGPSAVSGQSGAAESTLNTTPKPIAELVVQPDFPKCALGENVDIGGFVGVISDIVNQSIKVKSPDGIVQSFNFNRLRTLYGPKVRPELEPLSRSREAAEPEETKTPPAPVRNVITEPDFTTPIKPIKEFADRPDFPQCAFGQHVDIGGTAGIVIEIVKQSLRVMSSSGSIQSYNGPVLKKLYGQSASK